MRYPPFHIRSSVERRLEIDLNGGVVGIKLILKAIGFVLELILHCEQHCIIENGGAFDLLIDAVEDGILGSIGIITIKF